MVIDIIGFAVCMVASAASIVIMKKEDPELLPPIIVWTALMDIIAVAFLIYRLTYGQ